MTTTTLYRNGRVYSPADPAATALVVDGGVVSWLGEDADAPRVDETVDLAGALVTPAFVDAHVHATDTGITLVGLDLSGTRSRDEVLDAVAGQGGDVVLGHGFDESTWADRRPPSAAELDRAGGGRMVYLSQASVHSAVVSSALLARVRADAPGYDGTGWLRRDAHHVVRAVAHGSIPPAQRRAGQRAALRHAASLGIAAVHECGGPGTSSEDDFTGLLALPGSEPVPAVFGYWGELGAAAKAKELGAVGAGGDLYADGALGSRTAHLRAPYVDGAGHGFGYLTAGQVADHLVGCAYAGVQGGFHAIGDAAIVTVLAGFKAAAGTVGVERLRAGRHRIEHLEILDRELIRGLVEYGVTASVQPAFDRLWGGEHAMYAQCLGVARSLESNPLGALAGVGVALAFGSDSPVTPLDPWGSVLAAMRHHNPRYRIGVKTAFAAHTRGGWRAVHDDASGVLAPGAPATLAVWSAPGGVADGLPRLDGALPVCRRTVLRGTVIYDVEET
jgi:predicted amidohydrolase YtcJ